MENVSKSMMNEDIMQGSHSSRGRVRYTLICDLSGADLGLQCFQQRGPNDRSDVAGLAGTASKDDSDGLASSLIGHVIGSIGTASSASPELGRPLVRELKAGKSGGACGQRKKERAREEHTDMWSRIADD